MTDFYSRAGSLSIKKETTANTAVIPNVFIPFDDETISTQYAAQAVSPIAGDRTLNIRAVKKAIPAPAGDLKLSIEPKTFGHFINGVFGGVTSGQYMKYGRRLLAGVVTGTPQVGATLAQAVSLATGTVGALVAGNAYFDLSAISGAFNAANIVTGTNPDATTFTFTPSQVLNSTAFVVGDTVTGSTSTKTATVTLVNEIDGYLLVSAASGNFTASEKITGTGGGIATLIAFDQTVYGHQGTLPASPLPTYSLQLNFQDSAIRYMGVRFHAFDQIAQANNVMTATVKVMAQSQFRHAKITAITTAGSTKTITVDQTQGLVNGDIIKIYRPSTGAFLDLNGATVKIEAITAVVDTTSFTLATLTTAVAVGDLVMLAPQTVSTTVANEMAWVGGAIGQLGDSITSLTNSVFEDFTITLENQFEERHTAAGTLLANRFPTTLIQKGLVGKGSFKTYYQDEVFMSKDRLSTPQAFRIVSLGDLIGATLIPYEIRWTMPQVIFDPFQTNLGKENVVDEAVPFQMFKDATQGYAGRVLLVTTIASY